jgi:putative nucleotidyltransferase with HDIG domain
MGPIASREVPEAPATRRPSSPSGIRAAKPATPSFVMSQPTGGSGATCAQHGGTDYRVGESLTRYLPQVAVATLLVAVSPVVVVWLLRSAGVIGPWGSLILAMGLSTALSWVGCAYWKRSKGSGDLLFSELLVWGWLRRWRAQRRLASAVELLGLLKSDRQRPVGGSIDRQEELLRAVAAALEAEDRYTRGHSDRVARYAGSIARRMGLSDVEREAVCAAALVHDVGKLRIPAEVLNKPTKLTDAEFDLIKRHPVDGAEMVASLGNDELTSVVLHHHERMDGNGYPDGLTGDQIPLGARIIAVADTFDAITSVRPYRPRRAHKKALDILAEEQGLQLDRDAVRAFLNCYSGRRPIALWAVTASVLQRAVSWMTGGATAATVTTGNVVATAVATVAIGGVAMTPSVVARVAPIHSGRNVHTVARPGHANSGHALSSAVAGRPAGTSPLAGAPFGVNGPSLTVSSAVGAKRTPVRHPAAGLTRRAAHRFRHGHGRGPSHPRHRISRGHPRGPGAGKPVVPRGTGAKAAHRHNPGSNSTNGRNGAPAGARAVNPGNGNSSSPGPTAKSGHEHVHSPHPGPSHPAPPHAVAPGPPAASKPPNGGGHAHRTPGASSSHKGKGH